jgi:hypothetical protein
MSGFAADGSEGEPSSSTRPKVDLSDLAVLGLPSSRGAPINSVDESRSWNHLENKLYSNLNRPGHMAGVYVPHRDFVLVDAPKVVEHAADYAKESAAVEAPAIPKNETRKTWIQNLLEKKARLKRDAEGISESEASDNECAQERSKFRRRSKESKVNSSASELSDSEYSSAGPVASPSRGGGKGKTRRRVNVKGARGKTKKKIVVIEPNEDELDNDLLADFDPDADFFPGFLDDSQKKSDSKNKTQTKSRKPKVAIKHYSEDLQQMEKYWELEALRAEDDLTKFVLDFSTSFKTKDGEDGLVLDTFFETDEDDESGGGVPELDVSMGVDNSFSERALMTSLDTSALMESGLQHGISESMTLMSLEKSDFATTAAKIASDYNLSLSTSSGDGSLQIPEGIMDIANESSTDSLGLDQSMQ